MLLQAQELGISRHLNIRDLTTTTDSLGIEFEDFLSKNPDFNDGSFDFDLSLEGPQRGLDFEELVVEAVASLVISGTWARAEVGEPYVRHYSEGDEGTGWHDDADTGSDFVVIHTRFGRANFGAIRSDGANFNDDMVEGSVIAIRSSTSHFASSPIRGNREIEGIPIKLAI